MRVLVVYVAAFACNAGACVVVLIVSRRFSLHLLCKKLCNCDIFDNFMKKVFRKCSQSHTKSQKRLPSHERCWFTHNRFSIVLKTSANNTERSSAEYLQ